MAQGHVSNLRNVYQKLPKRLKNVRILDHVAFLCQNPVSAVFDGNLCWGMLHNYAPLDDAETVMSQRIGRMVSVFNFSRAIQLFQSNVFTTYRARTYRFRREREAGTELDFFRLVDSTVILPNIETTPQNTGASGKPQASASSASSRQ